MMSACSRSMGSPCHTHRKVRVSASVNSSPVGSGVRQRSPRGRKPGGQAGGDADSALPKPSTGVPSTWLMRKVALVTQLLCARHCTSTTSVVFSAAVWGRRVTGLVLQTRTSTG